METQEEIVNDNHWVIQADELTKVYQMGEVQAFVGMTIPSDHPVAAAPSEATRQIIGPVALKRS